MGFVPCLPKSVAPIPIFLVMHTRSRCTFFILSLIWMLAAAEALGSAGFGARPAVQAPRDLNNIATSRSALTDSQRADIARYAEYWSGRLATGEAAAVREAMRKLTEPVGLLGVRPSFRDEYSRALVPQLENLLDSTANHHVAILAMKVAPSLGTILAIDLIVARSNSEEEDREGVRVWAAIGFRSLVSSEHIETGRLTDRVRRFAQAAENEEHWHVLFRQFEALAAAPDSLQHQAAVINAVASRLEEQRDPSRSMQSLGRAAVLVRDQYLVLNTSGQREMGTRIGPPLIGVFRAALAHWDAAHADPEAVDWYLRALQSTEALLRLVDAQVRSSGTPDTDLGAAWRSGDQAQFTEQVRQWERVLHAPPYGR